MENDKYLSGAKEICAYIKENPRLINKLVKKEKLPAFKRFGIGSWKAFAIDLDKWLETQRTKFLKT